MTRDTEKNQRRIVTHNARCRSCGCWYQTTDKDAALRARCSRCEMTGLEQPLPFPLPDD